MSEITYKDVNVTSRVSGGLHPEKLVTCCLGDRFLVYIIEGHVHLQCAGCGTTYCQSDQCSGYGEMQRQKN